MKKMYKIIVFLTGFFSIIVFNFSALQAGLIEPTRSLKATAEDPSQLTVFSEPPGLSIKLDEKFVGQTPMRMNAVDLGTHQLRVGESVTEIYVEPGETFHISLFKNKFILFQVTKKEALEPSAAGKTSTSGTPAPEPSSKHSRTKEENRKAWERWMLFVNGSSKHF
jgi:hypothetical protein